MDNHMKSHALLHCLSAIIITMTSSVSAEQNPPSVRSNTVDSKIYLKNITTGIKVDKKYFTETNAIAPVVNVAPWLNADNMWFYSEYSKMKMWPVLDVVSTIQKWIDQSVSCEWLIDPASTSPKDLYDYFLKAWKDWIKTIYYVRSMSLTLDWAECESCTW